MTLIETSFRVTVIWQTIHLFVNNRQVELLDKSLHVPQHITYAHTSMGTICHQSKARAWKIGGMAMQIPAPLLEHVTRVSSIGLIRIYQKLSSPCTYMQSVLCQIYLLQNQLPILLWKFSLKKDPARSHTNTHLKVLKSFAGSHSFPFSDLIIDHCCVYKVVS